MQWLQIMGKYPLSNVVVGAQNDAMAMGARAALDEFARSGSSFGDGELAIVGCDGSSDFGQRLVTEGVLAGTVIMPLGAGRAVLEIAKMVHGHRPPPRIELMPVAFPDPAVAASRWMNKSRRSGD